MLDRSSSPHLIVSCILQNTSNTNWLPAVALPDAMPLASCYLQATAARSRGGEERERLLLLVLDGGVAVESRSRRRRRRRAQVVGTSIQKVAAPSVRAGKQGAARMARWRPCKIGLHIGPWLARGCVFGPGRIPNVSLRIPAYPSRFFFFFNSNFGDTPKFAYPAISRRIPVSRRIRTAVRRFLACPCFLGEDRKPNQHLQSSRRRLEIGWQKIHHHWQILVSHIINKPKR